MSNIVLKQASQLAVKLGIDVDQKELVEVLKQTAFRVQGDTQPTDAQLSALMIVANQYGLNPWTKEIYAFPDKKNGIVPIVGVDGWTRIINEHPAFDGVEFRVSDEMLEMEGAKSAAPAWCECLIYRKDRSKPVVIREYLDEVYRKPFTGKGQGGTYTVDGPWQTHPKRFLRHKTLIQCSRVAFGFSGIYDEDEAERIKDMGAADVVGSRPLQSAPAEVILPDYTADALNADKAGMIKTVAAGKLSVDGIVSKIKTRFTVSADMEKAIHTAISEGVKAKPQAEAEPAISADQIEEIRANAADFAISDADLCKQFAVASLDQLPASKFEAAMSFIHTGA
jgi:phage recombination protein Bet